MNINNNKTFKICYPFPDEWGSAYPKFIVLFRFACYYAIPLFIIGIFYVLIAKHLIHAANHCPGEIQGAKRQVIRKTIKKLLSYQPQQAAFETIQTVIYAFAYPNPEQI